MDHFISASANTAQTVFSMVPWIHGKSHLFVSVLLIRDFISVRGIKKDLYPSKKKEGNVLPALGLKSRWFQVLIQFITARFPTCISNTTSLGVPSYTVPWAHLLVLFGCATFQYMFPWSLGIFHWKGFTIASFPSWISSTSSFPFLLTATNSLQPLSFHCISKLRALFHLEILQNCFLLLWMCCNLQIFMFSFLGESSKEKFWIL